MPDEIVITDGGDSPETSSVHDAAVAEGASAVHEEHAEAQAEKAEAAAEQALQGAAANVAAAAAAEEAAQRSEAAAQQAGVSLEAIHEALIAQGAAISTLADEMRSSRKPEKPETTAGDIPPGTTGKPAASKDSAPRKRHWYYG